MRVQSDHWAIILEFCEQYPQIITNKFTALGSRNELNDLWKKLTIKLNSLGYGEKTVEGWKKTITDWKSKTKAKAGAIKTHISQTGGGMQCNLALTSYEERLLNIMGKTSYEGNPQNIERGIRKRKLFGDDNGESTGNKAATSTSTVSELVPIHKTDHTYVQDTDKRQDTNITDTFHINYDLPVTTAKIKPNYSKALPSIHFTNIPSPTSTQFATTSKTKDCNVLNPFFHLTNLEVPNLTTATPTIQLSQVPSSSTTPQFTPSRPKDSRLDLAPTHIEMTPTNSVSVNNARGKAKDRRRTENKNDGSEQLKIMHNELLAELKTMNENIGSIAESLKILAISLKK